MLTLTENAQTALDEIATRADLPDGGGLRISPSVSQPGGLDLGLAPQPVQGDDVVRSGGTPVFIDQASSPALSDLTLDTAPAPEGAPGPAFVLVPQQSD